ALADARRAGHGCAGQADGVFHELASPRATGVRCGRGGGNRTGSGFDDERKRGAAFCNARQRPAGCLRHARALAHHGPGCREAGSAGLSSAATIAPSRVWRGASGSHHAGSNKNNQGRRGFPDTVASCPAEGTMIEGLIKLLAFQLVGEAVVHALAIPMPGAVVGMALLFFYLVVRQGDPGLEPFTAAFLRHLSLLFIPAAVGIVAHLDRIAEEWLAITVALLASTVVAILTTAVTLKLLQR